MKKVLAIFVSTILLASALQVSIDRHYCGGQLSDIKFSVTGRLASCGMENQQHSCSNQQSINQKCCEDKLTYYSFDSKYYLEYFTVSHHITGKDIPAIPVFNVLFRSSGLTDLNSWRLPPGVKLKSEITLSELCVYRI